MKTRAQIPLQDSAKHLEDFVETLIDPVKMNVSFIGWVSILKDPSSSIERKMEALEWTRVLYRRLRA